MSFSRSVKSLKGICVRTPIARQTSTIKDHIKEFQGATAPASMDSVSSGTNVVGSTVRMIPVPSHLGQAPWLLNANSSAQGAKNSAPQIGQISFCSVATAKVGDK